MDFLFVEVRGTNKYINNGLAYLAGGLDGSSSFKIVDLNYLDWSENTLKKYIIDNNPKVLGFSVKSTNVSAVNNLINELKNKISSLIIVGGPHVSLLGQDYLKTNRNIDYGFKFEAESSISGFMDFLEGKKNIGDVAGLIYKANNQYCFNPYFFDYKLDNLPFPDYEHFEGIEPIQYFKRKPYPLLTSRGCPFDCIYCSVKIVSGTAWRSRSVENILRELILVKERYQINRFEIVDDNFTMDTARAIKFCQALREKEINLKWSCPNGVRADRINEELASVMFLSGCDGVALGIESGDEEVFNNIQKGEKLSDIVKAVEILKGNNIRVTGFFIVGLPFDNLTKTKKTLKFIEKLNLNGGIKWNFLIPYPHTQLWQWIEKNGRFLADFSSGKHFSRDGEKMTPIFETPDFDASSRLRAWKIANLSSGSYTYVFKIPNSKILFKIKIFFFLLFYTPEILISKLRKRIYQIFQ